MYSTARRRDRSTASRLSVSRVVKCERLRERRRVTNMPPEAMTQAKDFRPVRTRALRGRSAVSQARVILLVMINVAQRWILAATVEATTAPHYRVIVPPA